MIARLTGILDSQRPDGAVINVGGVGYLVFASSRTLTRLGTVGTPVSVYVDTHVREDHIHLYGFATEQEQHCFQVLQTVQGVGARAALAMLSALDPDEVMRAIAAQDRTTLTRADGIGPRIATRILNELKDRAAGWTFLAGAAGPVSALDSEFARDAISALVNLGYSRSEAHGAVANAFDRLGGDAGLDRVIAASLQELAS